MDFLNVQIGIDLSKIDTPEQKQAAEIVLGVPKNGNIATTIGTNLMMRIATILEDFPILSITQAGVTNDNGIQESAELPQSEGESDFSIEEQKTDQIDPSYVEDEPHIMASDLATQIDAELFEIRCNGGKIEKIFIQSQQDVKVLKAELSHLDIPVIHNKKLLDKYAILYLNEEGKKITKVGS